jgi:hypothetical protein
MKTENIENWDNKPVKHKKNKYPVPVDKNSPRMFFVGMFVGSRGSGKTFSIAKLIKQYEHYGIVDQETHEKVDQRVILFSPTVEANPVLSSLKLLSEEDVITNYSDEKLTKIIDDIKKEADDTKEYKRKIKLYKKFCKCKKVEELDQEELMELDMMNYEPPEKPTYPNGCVNHLIFDDLIGSSAFKSVGKSALTNLVLKNRHLQCCIYIATQNLKAIPKSIRTNTSLFCLYKFANQKIVLEDLYEEVSGILTPQKFKEVYEFATEGDHNALVMDFTGDKENRLRKNFNERIIFSH